MKAVILAGGKATRMGVLCDEIPKPMLTIGGKPLLEHHLILLKRYGITDIILVVHNLAEAIYKYFGDGQAFGVSLYYFHEEKPLGTAGSFSQLQPLLCGDDFLVLYGDVMQSVNLARFIAAHRSKKVIASLVLHPNDHPYDSDLVEIDSSGFIVSLHKKPHDPSKFYQNLVNAALYIMSSKIFNYLPKDVVADFAHDIFPSLCTKQLMYGYLTAEYIKDAGTPVRFDRVSKDYESGKIERLNNERKQQAIFIDRDGVINREISLLHKLDDFELLPQVAQAIRSINNSSFLAIVVTNQPVLARNLCSLNDLKLIHNKMETLLGQEHAKLDAIYFCPHHPDKGYQGENAEYKITCNCRKPAIGMLEQAARDFNIDLSASYMVGDSARDIECGKAAGMEVIQVKCNGEYFVKSSQTPDRMVDNLHAAVDVVLKQEEMKKGKRDINDCYKNAISR